MPFNTSNMLGCRASFLWPRFGHEDNIEAIAIYRPCRDVCMHVYILTYKYINICINMNTNLYLYIYIYMYMYSRHPPRTNLGHAIAVLLLFTMYSHHTAIKNRCQLRSCMSRRFVYLEVMWRTCEILASMFPAISYSSSNYDACVVAFC